MLSNSLFIFKSLDDMQCSSYWRHADRFMPKITAYFAIALRRTDLVDCVWNVMAHAQKPDFVFRRNGRVHLNRRGASVQSTAGRRAVHISLQSLYCSCKPVFCSHVTLTGYPLHSLVSPSLLLPCITVCHHISTGLYSKYQSPCSCLALNAGVPIIQSVSFNAI